ncbi:TRAP transporter large permease [Brevibacterium sp.]|uniref:TRAP transporter large permease n=1 Tax=Brevibacterium sp. TaxID=1701 RepID=UPI002810FCC1|nr:TRAP transporter large permease [Brevibacterium sp.]
MIDPIIFGTILIGLLLVLVLCRVPVAVALGVSSFITIIMSIGFEEGSFIAAQRMVSGVNSVTLLAIPFFVLAGSLMNNGGIAGRLIDAAGVIVGRMPGSLAQTNVVANALFGSVSGAAVASAAAVGSVVGPKQKAQGYSTPFAAAANVASAPSGMLIPPSNTLIVYSLVSGTSVAALFMAGYLPGILWMLGCIAVVWFLTRKKPELRDTEKPSVKVVTTTLLRAVPSILMIVVVIGGILIGFFTPTESAAIAVTYALILGFVYKAITVRDLPGIILNATTTTVIIIFLVAVSSIMSWAMAVSGLPSVITEGILSLTDNTVVIMVMITIILLLIGTILDPTPAILIFVPVFLPIVTELGIDPIHFGILVTFNLCLGTITPPVGVTLFVGVKIAGARFEQVAKALLPFFVVLIILLFVVVFVPQLSLALPGLVGLN